MNAKLLLTTCTVDLHVGRVQRGEALIRLSESERCLLSHLAQQEEHPYSSVGEQSLHRAIWGHQKAPSGVSVASLVEQLRHKIELYAAEPEHLVGKAGGPYRLIGASLQELLSNKPNLDEPDTTLLDRSEALIHLQQWLGSKQAALNISGPNGIGKSRLVRSFLESSQRSWLSCNLVHCRNLESALSELAYLLNLALDNTNNTAIEQIGRVLHNTGIEILFLDDLRHLSHSAPGCITRWLKLAPNLKIITSGLTNIQSPDITSLSLQPLSDTACLQLFKEGAMEPLGDGRRPIVKAMAGSPLTIRLYQAQLSWLKEAGSPKPGLPNWTQRPWIEDPDPESSLNACLRWTFSRLPTKTLRTLTRSSLFVKPFSLEHFNSIFQAFDGNETAKIIHWLVEQRLLKKRMEPGQVTLYQQHSSIATFCHLKSLGSTWHRQDQDTYCAWYSQKGKEWAEQVTGSQGAYASDKLTQHRAELLNAIELTTQESQRLELLLTTHWLALSQGPASAYLHLANDSQSSDLSPTLLSRLGLYQGEMAHLAGDLPLSMDYLQQSLQLATDNYQHNVRIECLARLGSLHLLQGQISLAHNYLNKALNSAHQYAPQLRAFCLERIGILQHIEGRLEQAKKTLQNSARLHHQNGNYLGALNAHSNLAMIHLESGSIDDVIEPIQQHLAHLLTLEHHRSTSHLCCTLGMALQELGRHQHAKKTYEQAQKLALNQGNTLSMSTATLRLALLHLELGHLSQARLALDLACRLFDQLGSPYYQGLGWAVKGVLAGSDCQPQSAEEAFGRSRVHLRGCGMPSRMQQIALLEVYTDFARFDLGQMSATSLTKEVQKQLSKSSGNALFTQSCEGRLYVRLLQNGAKTRLKSHFD